MTNNTNTNVPVQFDRAEVSRTVALIRHEITELVNDANRKRPFFSPTQKEATARRDAALKVLKEFAETLDALKKK